MSTGSQVLRAAAYRGRLVVPDELSECLSSTLKDLLGDAVPGDGLVEVAADGSGGYAIRSDGRLWNDAVCRDDVADGLVRMLLLAALDQEASLVHIHAGAVALGDRTVVIGGWAGSGKSTAITALVSSGYGYVTDERLSVAADGTSVAGFPKPISLIAGSFEVLAHLDPRRTGQGAANDTTWQIPASTLGPIADELDRAPSIIVFVDYQAGSAATATIVSPVVAAARLVADSPDVVARGKAGVRAIVALAASVPSIDIEFSGLDELVATVDDLLGRPPDFHAEEPLELSGVGDALSVAASSAAVDTSRCYAIAEGASVWVLGDGALSFVEATGSVVELAGADAVWVQLLDESTTIDELIDEVSTASSSEPIAVRETARAIIYALWELGVIGPTRDE